MNSSASNPAAARRDEGAGLLLLPATCAEVLAQVVDPALTLLPARMVTDAARVMLLAIGQQESGFERRTQIAGSARGLWQFEFGGILGVMRHRATAQFCSDWCDEHNVACAASTIYKALANDDVFAAGLARLLLWTDPKPLPALGDEGGAWSYYVRNWRPGKPGRGRFVDSYQDALRAVGSTA